MPNLNLLPGPLVSFHEGSHSGLFEKRTSPVLFKNANIWTDEQTVMELPSEIVLPVTSSFAV